MSDCKHIRVSGTIRVPLPRAEAFTLFTPTGERAYVDGWDPIFPSTVADESEPGTVFQTDHTGPQTTWIVLWRRHGEKIEYARVTPGDRAGVVSVSCSDAGDGTTAATVTYDLTALPLTPTLRSTSSPTTIRTSLSSGANQSRKPSESRGVDGGGNGHEKEQHPHPPIG